MRRHLIMLAALLAVVSLSSVAIAQDRLRAVYGSDDAWHVFTFDAVTGWPVTECAMTSGDGATAVTVTGTALDVNLASGTGTGLATEATLATRASEATVATLATEATVATLATEATAATLATEATAATLCTEATGASILADTTAIASDTSSIDGKTPALGQAAMAASVPVAIASNQTAIPTSTLAGDGTSIGHTNDALKVDNTGSAVDSSAAGQDASWRSVANPSGAADANKGSIPVGSVVAGTVVKVYLLPAGKEFHSISIAMPDSDANDFDYTVMAFTGNTYPSAVFTLNAWMSVSSLVVPSLRLARDRTKLTVAQPVIRSRDAYLMILINTVATAPAGDPVVRIRSWDSGDEVI